MTFLEDVCQYSVHHKDIREWSKNHNLDFELESDEEVEEVEVEVEKEEEVDEEIDKEVEVNDEGKGDKKCRDCGRSSYLEVCVKCLQKQQ